jgi:hypothetical protein
VRPRTRESHCEEEEEDTRREMGTRKRTHARDMYLDLNPTAMHLSVYEETLRATSQLDGRATRRPASGTSYRFLGIEGHRHRSEGLPFPEVVQQHCGVNLLPLPWVRAPAHRDEVLTLDLDAMCECEAAGGRVREPKRASRFIRSAGFTSAMTTPGER